DVAVVPEVVAGTRGQAGDGQPGREPERRTTVLKTNVQPHQQSRAWGSGVGRMFDTPRITDGWAGVDHFAGHVPPPSGYVEDGRAGSCLDTRLRGPLRAGLRTRRWVSSIEPSCTEGWITSPRAAPVAWARITRPR